LSTEGGPMSCEPTPSRRAGQPAAIRVARIMPARKPALAAEDGRWHPGGTAPVACDERARQRALAQTALLRELLRTSHVLASRARVGKAIGRRMLGRRPPGRAGMSG
jgi:hypothetical protein